MSRRDNIIRKLDERNDIIMADDGYYVFWPVRNHGYITANTLRIIADELDKRNEDWDNIINDQPVSEEWLNN